MGTTMPDSIKAVKLRSFYAFVGLSYAYESHCFIDKKLIGYVNL